MTESFHAPTGRLLAGLFVTLAAVAVFSWYALRQIDGLRNLQTRSIDRNRKDSLQLLRIQNDLNSLGLAIRDMLDGEDGYPLEAWTGQFSRIRHDLENAVAIQARLAVPGADSDGGEYLKKLLAQFWTSADQAFTLAHAGHVREARDLIRNSLQAQQAALATSVARLLVRDNEVEEQAGAQVQEIYTRVERNLYSWLLTVLVMIVLTSLYLIHSNRRVFEHLDVLSRQRSELARRLITVQEAVLHSIARELHDEFGQILTAIGAMLKRAEKQGLPPGSPFCSELYAVREVAQNTLEKTRSLSQMLHPPILDDEGLEQAIDWYLPLFERQTGIAVEYDKRGTSPPVGNRIGVHVYRVLQEALNNLARHSRSPRAWVRVHFSPDRLRLEVEDRGGGIPEFRGSPSKRGSGLIAMRERAELLHARLQFLRPSEGGTLVRLDVPIPEAADHDD